ncbi:MAG: hypothetical protein AABX05_01900, partial [Nanoarchaeota archaeon]
MKIKIDPIVFQKFHPKLRIAFFHAAGIDNKSKAKEAQHLLKEIEKIVLLTSNKKNFKSELLLEPWAVAKQEFGKKAHHYHTSVEQLLKKVLEHKNVAAKDTMTSLMHYLALKHILPMSADDPSKISGNITFSVSTKKDDKLKKGELYYHDAKSVLGTKLDYWKNAKAVLKPSSRSALAHIEFLPPVSLQKQKEAIAEMTELLKTFCGGKVKVAVL